MEKNKKILVTGGRGFVGSNLINELKQRELNYYAPTKEECDLRKEENVKKLFDSIFRVLKQNGKYIFISLLQDFIISFIL